MSSKPHQSKPHPSDPAFWTVVNDLPNPIPVGKDELDAVERYFADVLDTVFENKHNAAPTETVQNRKRA